MEWRAIRVVVITTAEPLPEPVFNAAVLAAIAAAATIDASDFGRSYGRLHRL